MSPARAPGASRLVERRRTGPRTDAFGHRSGPPPEEATGLPSGRLRLATGRLSWRHGRTAIARHYLAGHRWDRVADGTGEGAFVDTIHLTDPAAERVAALVGGFVLGTAETGAASEVGTI